MELTGHLTRSVFDRYNIVNEADLREGAAKLARAGQDRQVLRCRPRTGPAAQG